MKLCGARCRGAVVPKFDVTLCAQRAFLDEASFLAHKILNGDRLIGKDLEVIADQMSVFTAWALDQDCSMMVALFGQAMRRSGLADVAGEGELVGGDLVTI
jgi:hypothetical protein